MRDSMHLLEFLQRRGYEPQDDAAAGEGWFDRRCSQARLRVILAEDAATVVMFSPPMVRLWAARYDDGTPAEIIVAALRAAEHQAPMSEPGLCPECSSDDWDRTCSDQARCRVCGHGWIQPGPGGATQDQSSCLPAGPPCEVPDGCAVRGREPGDPTVGPLWKTIVVIWSRSTGRRCNCPSSRGKPKRACLTAPGTAPPASPGRKLTGPGTVPSSPGQAGVPARKRGI
jgi:hypothetical protein